MTKTKYLIQKEKERKNKYSEVKNFSIIKKKVDSNTMTSVKIFIRLHSFCNDVWNTSRLSSSMLTATVAGSCYPYEIWKITAYSWARKVYAYVSVARASAHAHKIETRIACRSSTPNRWRNNGEQERERYTNCTQSVVEKRPGKSGRKQCVLSDNFIPYLLVRRSK